MADLGYDTHNPFLNLKTLVLFQLLYLIRLWIFALIDILKRCYKGKYKSKVKKAYAVLNKQLIFSEILVIYFGSIIEFMVAGTLY